MRYIVSASAVWIVFWSVIRKIRICVNVNMNVMFF